ncbi:MAG TPA: PQQ-binding-like beta-propeller repeat protein, partial [Anaeromyxobacteraceae bacterium]|nr:PQQ-binding-like beta-propeller repeat protein [Anaeromyxobacteraceae bacterium]
MRSEGVKAALLVAALCGCAGEMKHTKVTKLPQEAFPILGLEKIGNITSMESLGDVLYVAGEQGLGAVRANGSVVWTLGLPKASLRSLAVEGARIVFTSYSLQDSGGLSVYGFGFDSASGYLGCAVGLATTQGSLVWTTPCGEGEAASPPAIGAGRVGVSHGKYFGIYDLGSGRRVSHTQIGMQIPVLATGSMARASYNRPAFLDGSFYVGHLHKFVRIDPGGEIEIESRGFSIFRPFENITVGPLLVGNVLVFAGMSSDVGESSRLYAADKSCAQVWTQRLGDSESGVGSLAVRGDRLYVATNNQLFAYKASGERLWRQSGGWPLSPSSLRGVRTVSGATSLNSTPLNMAFMSRRWNGSLLEATDERVFLASAIEGRGDALTVLDAATGQYIETRTFGGAKIL